MKPINSILNFKDMNVINSYRFKEASEAIMTFQTNYNGTFAPILTPSNGTLKWIVDGVTQISNTPSYSLIGNTVDVEVYANDVALGEQVTNVALNNLNIIGTLDFSHFTINGNVNIYTNTQLTSVVFSTFNNVITDRLYGYQTGCVSFDFSNLTFDTALLWIHLNSQLTTVTLNNSSVNSLTGFRGYSTSITGLNFTNFSTSGEFRCNVSTLTSFVPPNLTSTSTYFDLSDTSASIALNISNFTINGNCFINSADFTSVTFSSSGNTSNNLSIDGSAFTTLDFSGWNLSSIISIHGNSQLQSVIFSTNNGTITDFQAYSNGKITSYDLSNLVFNGRVWIHLCPNLNSITFSTGSNVINAFRIYDTAISTLDLSNVALSGVTEMYSLATLTGVTWGTYQSTISSIRIDGCALTLASIDSLFSSLNTYLSANAPQNDFTVLADGGTNTSPTNGAANTDIVNLDTVVYPNAGFDFIFSIN